MHVLVISDIHANLAALTAVLAAAEGEWEQLWCLGDLIGYGPDPDACVALLREQPNLLSLSGNHDWAVLGKLDLREFNREAQMAIRWAQETITAETRDYLDSLPPLLVEPPFTLAHASPRRPIWEYILDGAVAAANFNHFETDYCLVGHSHVPVLFEQQSAREVGIELPVYGTPVQLNGRRLIINPGSVGQPRDADPRAAYALLDTETLTWEFRRAAYPVEETQARMREHKMPPRLVNRLAYGW